MATKTKQQLADSRKKSLGELQKLLRTEQKALFMLRMKNAVRGLKQTHLIREKRKQIARIQTVIKEKQTAALATNSRN